MGFSATGALWVSLYSASFPKRFQEFVRAGFESFNLYVLHCTDISSEEPQDAGMRQTYGFGFIWSLDVSRLGHPLLRIPVLGVAGGTTLTPATNFAKTEEVFPNR